MNPESPTPYRAWFLPSWLGLDAPCVVCTWTWSLATALDRPLPAAPLAALFFTVWSIYLLDRLIDVARCRDWEQATGRLRFARRRQPLFLGLLLLCGGAVAILAARGLPPEVLLRGALVAGGMLAYFLLFVTPLLLGRKLRGKEFGVGLFFALGAFAVLGYTPGSWPELAAIAGVVAYNCLVIAARDREADLANDPAGAAAWWPGLPVHLKWMGLLFLGLSLAATFFGPPSFHLAAAGAVLLLLVLHRAASRLSDSAVRAFADFCLLTPWLVLPLEGALTRRPL